MIAAALGIAALAASAGPAQAGRADLRPDGTVLFSTLVTDGGEPGRSVVVAVRPDGTLDPAFGNAGGLWGPEYAFRGDVVVLPAGTTHALHGQSVCPYPSPHSCEAEVTLQRFDAAGAVRESAQKWREDSHASLPSPHLVPSGDTLLWTSAPYGVLARVSAEGTGDGYGETVDFAELPEGGPTALAPIGDGAVVGGYGQESAGAVLRFDAELDPVAAFGEAGTAELPFTPRALAAAGDDVLAGGGGQVARLGADGNPDEGFGDGGVATLTAGGRPLDVSVLAPVAGGALMVGGTTTDAEHDFAVIRLRADGTPDPDYGTGGAVTVRFPGRQARLEGLVALASGAVVAAGGAQGDDRRAAAARLTPGGALDETFGDGGRFLAGFDMTAPGLEILEPAPGEHRAGVVVEGPVRVVVASPEPGAALTCAIARVEQPCDEPATFDLAEHGSHAVRAAATDANGNIRRVTRSFRLSPETRIETGPPARTDSRSAAFTWTSATTGVEGVFSCSVDGGPWARCTSPFELTGLPDGRHSLGVRQELYPQYDDSRTVEVTPAAWSWRVGPEPVQPPGGGPPQDDGRPPSGEQPPVGEQPPAGPTLAERRDAARRGLRATVSRERRVRRGVSLSVASAVAARVRVTGTVAVGGRRRALRAFSGPVASGSAVRARLKVPARTARALGRGGARRVVVRLRVTLSEPGGTRLVTETLRLRLRR